MSGRVERMIGCAVLGAFLSLPLVSTAAETIRVDKGHVYRWNRFTDDLYKLHQAQLERYSVRTEVELNGYAGREKFYREERFFDLDNGNLLSVIQRESANPDNIHSIEVYVYDDRGRVSRDYSSSYLPDYRNAPSQTLIFIHRYNDGLHAYRAFDASDELLSERCEGDIDGEDIFIDLDIDEIEAAMVQRYQSNSGLLTEPDYLRCFEGMPESAAAYLPPR